ncbi:uncharacterized protein LOC144069338 isoform X1 [Stigmatopora argus]
MDNGRTNCSHGIRIERTAKIKHSEELILNHEQLRERTASQEGHTRAEHVLDKQVGSLPEELSEEDKMSSLIVGMRKRCHNTARQARDGVASPVGVCTGPRRDLGVAGLAGVRAGQWQGVGLACSAGVRTGIWRGLGVAGPAGVPAGPLSDGRLTLTDTRILEKSSSILPWLLVGGHQGTRRVADADPRVQGARRVTAADPLVQGAQRVAAADPLVQGPRRVAAADPIVQGARRFADPLVQGARRVTAADPLVQGARRVAAADPLVQGARRVAAADPLVQGARRVAAADPSSRGPGESPPPTFGTGATGGPAGMGNLVQAFSTGATGGPAGTGNLVRGFSTGATGGPAATHKSCRLSVLGSNSN